MKIKHKKILLLIAALLLIFISYKLIKFYSAPSLSKDIIRVHYIDVGQGDSILVQVNGKNLLIDAGPEKNQKSLNKYLNSLNIQKLDYIIATHPHEDHIGNMAFVINKYNVGKFYAPKVTTNTKSFETMIEALISKNLKVTVINKDTNTMDLGPNTKVTIFSPTKDDYDDNLNLYSPFIKIEFKNISFLFTGDGEKSNEAEILQSNSPINSTILKIGHHGSSTSTSEAFLKAVDPSVVVISVGKNNSYKHPTNATLSLLSKNNLTPLRTDLLGSILLVSDGYKIYKQ